MDAVGGLMGGDFSFLKALFYAKNHWPLFGERLVFGLSCRLGHLYSPWSTSCQLPRLEQFHLGTKGTSSSIRGLGNSKSIFGFSSIEAGISVNFPIQQTMPLAMMPHLFCNFGAISNQDKFCALGGGLAFGIGGGRLEVNLAFSLIAREKCESGWRLRDLLQVGFALEAM